MKIAIIGAGLAGTALAYTLKQAGVSPEIFEAGETIAGGASGNPIGLVNPRFSAHRNPESDYYTSAFSTAVRLFETIQKQNDIGWKKCGALHLMVDEKKQKRFPQTLENWNWPDEHMKFLNKQEASDIAGIPLNHDALYLPDSGLVSPQKLCNFFAKDCPTHLNTPIKSLNEIDSDITILACGSAMLNFEETKDLPLKPVRGQITQIKATKTSQNLKCNLGFGGYCSPAIDGIHTLGATFQRWLDHSDILEEDDQDNINKLRQFIPVLSDDFKITGHRASVRTASKDHFPVVGKLPGFENIYISTAHGSHGIVSSLAAAQLTTDMILKHPLSQSLYTVNTLSPARFKDY